MPSMIRMLGKNKVGNVFCVIYSLQLLKNIVVPCELPLRKYEYLEIKSVHQTKQAALNACKDKGVIKVMPPDQRGSYEFRSSI